MDLNLRIQPNLNMTNVPKYLFKPSAELTVHCKEDITSGLYYKMSGKYFTNSKNRYSSSAQYYNELIKIYYITDEYNITGYIFYHKYEIGMRYKDKLSSITQSIINLIGSGMSPEMVHDYLLL